MSSRNVQGPRLAGTGRGTSADTLYNYVEETDTMLGDELRESMHDVMKMEKAVWSFHQLPRRP
jgi:hypothetical protein